MPGAARTFRLFVSSTFSDLAAERNALQERVFPRLRELCAQHGARFQAIDLRWGVSDEAALDQQTMPICLGEIERCRQVTPRPNFLVLLGDRYGWRPLPAEIPAAEYEALERHIPAGEGRALLQAWYRRDDNAVPPAYILQPRTGEYAEYAVWEGRVERPLRLALQRAAEAAAFRPEALVKYVASATEQEIVQGALAVEDAPEHVFCFFRAIAGLPADERAAGYIDLDPAGRPDEEARARLRDLKRALSRQLPGNIRRYRSTWTGSGPATDHLDRLCAEAYEALSRVILAELARLEAADPLQQEAEAHEAFGRERARFFTGRSEALEAMAAYLRGGSSQPFVVWGASGAGKSALLAQAAAEAQRAHAGACLIVRYIGATPGSTSGRALLEGLCRQIARGYGQDEDGLPTDYRDLAPAFRRRLALARADRPLVILLDALDQLSAADHAHDLAWLPLELPPHVRLIASILPGERCDSLARQLPPQNVLELEPLPAHEGEALLQRWLQDAGRTLQPGQRAEVLGRFAACGLPFYLRLAFEEARRWRSWEEPACLSPDIPGAIRRLFALLSAEANHGPVLVSRTLGYLAAARNGLAEDELLDLLSADPAVMADFRRRSPQSPPVNRLPAAVWSRLHLDMTPYLAERGADGAVLLSFYHRQVADAAAACYLAGDEGRERHRSLARYFGAQPLWLEGAGERRANLRRASEWPYQLTLAAQWAELAGALTDLDLVEAKCAAGMAYDLVADYDRIGAGRAVAGPVWCTARLHEGRYGVQCPYCLAWYEAPPEDLGREGACPLCSGPLQVRAVALELPWHPAGSLRPGLPGERWAMPRSVEVDEFADFIRAQAHILAAYPGLAFQQAHNQPDHTAPARRAAARVEAGLQARPWLRRLNKPQRRESRLAALPVEGVIGTTYTPDGRLIVGGRADGTLVFWDAAGGMEVAATGRAVEASLLPGSFCVFSPDGRWAALMLRERPFRLLECSTGAVTVQLSPAELVVHAVRFTADGRRAVLWGVAPAAGDAGVSQVRVYALESGEQLAALSLPHRFAFHDADPAGRRILGGFTGTVETMRKPGNVLRLFDVQTGEALLEMEGHDCWLITSSFSPDGRRIVSGANDRRLKVWDAESGALLSTLVTGETWEERPLRCAFSPDGRRVMAWLADGCIKLWDARTGKLHAVLAGGRSPSGMPLGRTPDPQRLIVQAERNTARVWDAEEGVLLATLTGGADVAPLKLSPDGRRLFSQGCGIVWDLLGAGDDGAAIAQGGVVKLAACSPGGGQVAFLDAASTLSLWDVHSSACRVRARVGSVARAIIYSPDSRRIAVIQAAGAIAIYDAASGELVAASQASWFEITHCSFSPDSRRLIIGSAHGTVKVLDAETARLLQVMKGPRLFRLGHDSELASHSSEVRACAFSPDGRLAASRAEDGLKVWDPRTGRPAAAPGDAASWLDQRIYSPDRHLMPEGLQGNTLRVKDAQTGQTLASFVVEGAFLAAGFGPDSVTLGAGDSRGSIYALRLVNVEPGPPVLTAWQPPAPAWQPWRGGAPAFCCPYCGRWAPVRPPDLGAEVPCPHCGRAVKLNPFTIGADWRPHAAASGHQA